MNSEAGQITVTATPVALFGKRSGSSDYEWLTEPVGIPESLVNLAVFLSSAADIPIAVVHSGDPPWIVRSFTGGLDYAHRPVVTTEILRLTDAVSSPEDLLLLASATLRLPGNPSPAILTIASGALVAQPIPPSDEQERHARIGAPLSVSAQAALYIARERSWRYDGFCYARSPGVRWDGELAKYLCINIGPAVLTSRDEDLLHVANNIPSEEWPLLQRLSRSELRDVLEWMGRAESTPLPAASEGVLAWLVKRQRSRNDGNLREIVHAVSEAIGGINASHRVVRAVAAELPADVRSTFLALAAGERATFIEKHVEYLARAGYLQLLGPEHLFTWTAYACASKAVADAAIELLTRSGFSPQQAAFVLDVEAQSPSDDIDVSSAVEALDLAAAFHLPEPVRRLRALFRTVGIHDYQTLVDARSSLGSYARTIIEAATEEHAFRVDIDEDLEIILALRSLLTSPSDAVLSLTQSMLLTDTASARRFFSSHAAAAGISSETAALVDARLGGQPTAALPSVRELERLRRADLVRAQDVNLVQADHATTRAVAALWPETGAFGSLLDGRWTGVPRLPSSWLSAARRFLKPRDLTTIAGELAPEQIDDFLGWICDVHGLDRDLVVGMSSGEASLVAGRDASGVGEWLGVIFPEIGREGAGAALVHLVRSGIAQGNAALARQIVSPLVPAASKATDEWLVHALCGLGPMPLLKNVTPRLVAQLAPHIDAVELIDALVLCEGVEAAHDADVIAAVCGRIEQTGVSCPLRGYSEAQLHRVPLLMTKLSQLPGWETVTGHAESRRRLAIRALDRLGLTAEDINRMVSDRPDPPRPPLRSPEEGE